VKLAQLVFGWLFLAGLIAAGTYYALDQLDQHAGLARLGLHQMVGVVRYPAVQPPIQPPAPPIQNPAIPVQPPPAPSNPVTPPANNLTPPTNPNLTPPYNATNPPQSNLGPPYNNQRPAYGQRPPYTNPNLPYPNQPAYNNPQRRQLPPGYNDTYNRLVQVNARANATNQQWNAIRQQLARNRQSLRPEIQTALNAMVGYTQSAQGSFRSGDMANCRNFMDQAERQMAILQRYRTQ